MEETKRELLNILEQYEDIKKETDKLENRIDKLRKMSSMVSDVVQNGYKRHAVIYGVDLRRQEKIHKLEDILQKRYDELLELQIKIEEYLNTLPSDIRQILEHRYIDNMNWVQVQIAMGYKHEDAARKKHDRFFEKF